MHKLPDCSSPVNFLKSRRVQHWPKRTKIFKGSFLFATGESTVLIAGREISLLEKGNFVGEVAFLTERPATATVIAESSVRALVFDKDKLSRFFRSDAEVARSDSIDFSAANSPSR